MRNSAIRERAANALLDYPLVEEFVEPEDAVDEVGAGLVEALKAQLRFTYLVARAADLDAERLFDDAAKEAKLSRVEAIKQRYEADPEAVTVGELHRLVEAGEIGREEYNEHVRRPIGNVSEGDDAVQELFDAAGEERDDDADGGGG